MKHAITKLLLITGCIGLLTPLVAAPAGAIDLFPKCSGSNAGTSVCQASSTDNANSMVANIISVMLYGIGIGAVIMIVVGGFKYVTSNGDSNNIQSAKNTILYAVIGLVVAILGQAIVLFVTRAVT